MKSKSILLIEDDLVDVMTVKRALKEGDFNNELVVKENGIEALDWLNQNVNKMPGLILLDINMPKMNGHEFLQNIKIHERLRLIPVVILTTSTAQDDKVKGFNEHASGYLIKPVCYSDFISLTEKIKAYWQENQLAY